MHVERLGRWSATAVVAIGGLYLGVVTRGISVFGLTTPIGDPILAIMEVITILSAVAITVMVAAIAAAASEARRVLAALALIFTGLFAGATTVVHVVSLTAGRQTGVATLTWPSVLYAAELAAWDTLLGIALIFVALTFERAPGLRAIRVGFVSAGTLCLAGMIGPALGDMRLQRIGIAGYAVVLPLVCALVAREFHRRVIARGSAVADLDRHDSGDGAVGGPP